jgi:hypothetical protein
MASLPHTPATREPLTTLGTALFGDQSTPASPLPASNTTVETSWQDAVTRVGEQLRATLRVEVLPDRLHKALALVLAHAVTLHPDGTASVQHGTQTSRLAPDCPLHRRHAPGRTLHAYAGRRAAPPGTCPAQQHRPSQQSHGRASPRERATASQCGSTASSATRR